MKAQSKNQLTLFEQYIENEYFNSEFMVFTVRKYKFESHFYPGFRTVNDLIENQKFDIIPKLVGSLLTTINDKLSQIKGEEKEILEKLAGELFSDQISILNSTVEGQKCWEKCLPILETTCEFKGYDFGELSKYLNFNFIKKPQQKISDKQVILPYYDWVGNKNKLYELINDLKSKQWIRNVNEFKKIFNPIINQQYKFCASSLNKEKLLVLFSELKKQNLIIPRKTNGHLYPLFLYGVDLEKKLFEKEPKRYLENLKRKKLEYATVLDEVNRLIRLNK